MGSRIPNAILWNTAFVTVLFCAACAWFARAQDAPAAAPDPDTLARGMTGELLKNTRFDKWEGGRPVGWGWNANQGSSAKPGPEGPTGDPTLEMVPNPEGVMDFGTMVDLKSNPVLPGDTLLLDITLKVDEDVPMEIRITMTHGPDASERTAVPLPFQGDGNWNTLQFTLPDLPNDLARLNLDIRIRGAKQGTAYLGSASLRVSPAI